MTPKASLREAIKVVERERRFVKTQVPVGCGEDVENAAISSLQDITFDIVLLEIVLRKAIDELSEDDSVIMLKYFEDYIKGRKSMEQIANELQITVKALYAKVDRIKPKLISMLEKNGI